MAPQARVPDVVAVRLRCGTLTIHVERAQLPLHELCAFGSRRNRKRGFLFISKVLGKHTPVRPAQMHHVHELLARKLSVLQEPAVIVALAETATGLGHGIFEELLRQTDRRDVLFLHSTRYRLAQPLTLTFRESHSHATEHLVYFPSASASRELFDHARSLVLVDDELSTGQTVVNLARELLKVQPHVDAVHFVSITDWLSDDRRAQIAVELGRQVQFHSLLSGHFQFEPDATFDPGPIPDVVGAGDLKDRILAENWGRFSLRAPLRLDLEKLVQQTGLRGGERVLVLGTGEFAHAPYLLARQLEASGWDVHFQSTTRSPILTGEGIADVLEFTDNYHDEIPNYVYNVDAARYDRILIGYETQPLPDSHRLANLLGATPLFFTGEGT
jgi:hypothetical protein